MWPHRRQPTRLPRPRDSPGKNTGVGCHFLLQCMIVKSESEITQLVTSNSSQPHGLQPTRLLRPLEFPGRSTGVGCHTQFPKFTALPSGPGWESKFQRVRCWGPTLDPDCQSGGGTWLSSQPAHFLSLTPSLSQLQQSLTRRVCRKATRADENGRKEPELKTYLSHFSLSGYHQVQFANKLSHPREET